MSSSPLRVALHLSLLLSAAVSAPSKEFYGLTLVTNSPATFGLVQLHGATGAGAVVGPAHKQLFGTGDLVAVAVRILMSSFPPPDVNVIPESHSCLVPSFNFCFSPPGRIFFDLVVPVCLVPSFHFRFSPPWRIFFDLILTPPDPKRQLQHNTHSTTNCSTWETRPRARRSWGSTSRTAPKRARAW